MHLDHSFSSPALIDEEEVIDYARGLLDDQEVEDGDVGAETFWDENSGRQLDSDGRRDLGDCDGPRAPDDR